MSKKLRFSDAVQEVNPDLDHDPEHDPELGVDPGSRCYKSIASTENKIKLFKKPHDGLRSYGNVKAGMEG